MLKVNHKLTINWSMVDKHTEVTRSLNVVNVDSQVYVASSIDTDFDQLNEFLKTVLQVFSFRTNNQHYFLNTFRLLFRSITTATQKFN